MKLYIFRHGQTDGNVRNIVQGAGVDIELNETGRRQAERLTAELKGEGLDVIYASPMKRADETARIVAAAARCSRYSHARAGRSSFRRSGRHALR